VVAVAHQSSKQQQQQQQQQQQKAHNSQFTMVLWAIRDKRVTECGARIRTKDQLGNFYTTARTCRQGVEIL